MNSPVARIQYGPHDMRGMGQNAHTQYIDLYCSGTMSRLR